MCYFKISVVNFLIFFEEKLQMLGQSIFLLHKKNVGDLKL